MAHCIICNEPIVNKRADTLYCSGVCGSRSRNQRYKSLHPEKIKAQRRVFNSNRERYILQRVKHRAKRMGLDYNLDITDIIIPDKCPVLGLELSPNRGTKQAHDNSPSLDRIDPTKGYIKGNVRVISYRANLLKSNAQVWELKAVLKDLEGLSK